MGIIKSLIEIKEGKSSIIRYQGGLGNQMFQYAFKLKLISEGFQTYDDLSFYDFMPFVLEQVFKNVSVSHFTKSNLFTRISRKIVENTKLYKRENNYTEYDDNAICHARWYEGYWQSYKYYAQIRKEILEAFTFKEITDSKLRKLEETILSSNAVSVHVRAGDYLKIENAKNFGGICTIEYYNKAINYMKEYLEDPIFIVFSDDIEWTKKNIDIQKVIYFESTGISEYEDWMDMYLMSLCKGNIIANSSFSWWGAWLNENPQKKVVCPEKWTNNYRNIEVCPKEWIRLNGE